MKKARKSNRNAITTYLFGILGLSIASSLLFSGCEATQKAREAAQRCACTNNMKALEMAMIKYYEKHNQLPPAYTTDASGKPLHSWRTLLLPFLGQDGLYAQLKLDEPWDSTHNLAVFENAALPCFQCPGDTNGAATRTNYVLVVGPKNVSDGPNGCTYKNLANGTSNTAHIVETTVPISWYEPQDLKAEEINFKINDPTSPGIGSHHPGFAAVSWCDGSVCLLKEDEVQPEKLRAVFDITNTLVEMQDVAY